MTATTIAKSDTNRPTSERTMSHAFSDHSEDLEGYVIIVMTTAKQMGIRSSQFDFSALELIDPASGGGRPHGKILVTSTTKPAMGFHSHMGQHLRGMAPGSPSLQPSVADWNQPQYRIVVRKMRRLTNSFYVAEGIREWRGESTSELYPAVSRAIAGPPVVQEFAAGVDGVAAPAPAVVQRAERAVQAALDHTANTHITVDEDDGSLDFHLRLADGLLVMANLFTDGAVDASVYDDRNGSPVLTVRRMRRSAAQAEDLVRLFQGGIDANTKR